MKYVLGYTTDESLEIRMDSFDSYDDAKKAMEQEMNDTLQILKDADIDYDYNLGEFDGYICADYDYVWSIKAIE